MRKNLSICTILCLCLITSTCTLTPKDPTLETASPPEMEDVISASANTPKTVFSAQEFPRMDGSAQLFSFACAITTLFFPEDVRPVVSFTDTKNSLDNLMCGAFDMVFSDTLSSAVSEALSQTSDAYTTTPFAYDGLVFLVSKANPIENLTLQEIQKIYNGSITNWSQLGGDSVDIVPFQQPKESGSQTAMQTIVMQQQSLIAPRKDAVIDPSGRTQYVLQTFDGSPGAIGYFPLATILQSDLNTMGKVISVDDIYPDTQTIASGDYPLYIPYFITTSAHLPESSPTARLLQWIFSDYGSRLIRYMNYYPWRKEMSA